jgi:hypothetical protein
LIHSRCFPFHQNISDGPKLQGLCPPSNTFHHTSYGSRWPFERVALQPQSSPPNLPLHIRDADLLSRLLIVVEPLTVYEVNARELGVGLNAGGVELSLQPSISTPRPYFPPVSFKCSYLRRELRELQSSTIKLHYVLCLRRIRLRIRRRCCFYVRRMLPLISLISSQFRTAMDGWAV